MKQEREKGIYVKVGLARVQVKGVWRGGGDREGDERTGREGGGKERNGEEY